MRLDRLDRQEQLLRDRAVALADRRELADLALARGQRRGALERRLARPQAGRHELAARALGQQHRARRVGVGQRGTQRVARLDAPPELGQRAAELEPQPRTDSEPGHRGDHRQPALAQRDARGGVGLGDGAGVQRARRSAAVRRSASPARARRRPAPPPPRGGRGAPARSAAVERQGSSDGFGRPCSARSAPVSIASAWARSKSPSASAQPRAGVAHADLPRRDAERAVEPRSRSSSCASSNAPRSASAQTSTSAAPPVNTLSPSSTSSSASRAWFSASATRPLRSACSAAYHAAATRSRSDPRRSASSRSGDDHGAGLGSSVATSTRAQSAYARRRCASASSRPPSSASQRQRRAGRGAGACRARSPTHARCASTTRCEQRVGRARQIDRRHPPRALGVALGDDQQRVQRRGLDRQPDVGIGLAGELGVEQPDQARRRRPRRGSAPPGASARRSRQSRSPTSRSASRSRRRESGSPASNATVPSARSIRPRSSPGARSSQRPLQVARPPPAARRPRSRDAARGRRYSLTSGSACGPHSSRCAATTRASAPPSISARAASRCSRSRSVARQVVGDRDRDQPVREALAARRRAARRPAARRAPAPSSPTGTPATAASTCGGAPSPITASASTDAAVARATAPPAAGARRARARRARPSARRRPRAAIWRAELGQQPRVAADVAMAVAADRRGVSGASRRISCAAPRGVSGCGCSTVAERTAEQAQQVRRVGLARAPTRISSGRSSTRRAR